VFHPIKYIKNDSDRVFLPGSHRHQLIKDR
jgi:hypothetical protein